VCGLEDRGSLRQPVGRARGLQEERELRLEQAEQVPGQPHRKRLRPSLQRRLRVRGPVAVQLQVQDELRPRQ